jgi:ankyrin repeat protein
MLLEAGADVLAVTRASKTSLDIAQKYNKQDAVKELLKLGAVLSQNVVKS